MKKLTDEEVILKTACQLSLLRQLEQERDELVKKARELNPRLRSLRFTIRKRLFRAGYKGPMPWTAMKPDNIVSIKELAA